MSNSVFDELLKGIGGAITDIREKVVEEAYFGRTVTDGAAPEQPAAESTAPSMGGKVSVSWPATDVPSAWDAQIAQAQATPQAPERSPEHDIER